MNKRRIILHIDMNSFFASVEIANNPNLVNKPVAIAGNTNIQKGIVVTCSYEARKQGVKTTMPLWEAKKLCPSLLVIKANIDLYREVSSEIMEIFREITPIVEPASIDEAYLDITEIAQTVHPVKLAESIQQKIFDEMKLPCSIGIGPNKFLAKTASDMKKPMGITVLRRRDVPFVLFPLPVEQLHGVGKATALKLQEINITTVEELANVDDYTIKNLLGVRGIQLKNYANGIDYRDVNIHRLEEIKTIGNSSTFLTPTSSIDALHEKLQALSEKVSLRLKKKNVVSTRLSLTIKFATFKTITRSRSYTEPIQSKDLIYKEAVSLLHENWNDEEVRLLGITSLDNTDEAEANAQLDLFSYKKYEKENNLSVVLQQLQNKFGENAVKKGKEYWKEK